MVVKVTSTQTTDTQYPENGNRPYYFCNSEKYTPEEWGQMLDYLKRNAAAKLLKYEIVQK